MKPASNSVNRRVAAQLHALAAVRRDIRSHGSTGPRKYLREFTQAFRTYDAVLTTSELDVRIANATVLLVGDYHSLPASQRFTADLIEHIAASRPVILGVEAILSRDQETTELWWRREISEEEFRQRISFDREWGYEWAPFYELLLSARDHAEGIYGLDCMPRHDMRRIRSRDRHAAAKIAEMRARHPNATLLVLFGESHMAPDHLPRDIERALPGESVLTIIQNIDALYWQGLGENAGALSLGKNAVCVFNSTPLEKYESYRLCLERWHSDDSPDYTPAVHNLILSLARSLGFRTDSPRNGTQPKLLADSLPEVAHIGEHDSVNSFDEKQAAALERFGCVYAPQTNTFFVREFKIADVAGEAARFLHHACKGMPPQYSATEIEDQLAYLAAKMFCPVGANDARYPNPKGDSLYQKFVNGEISKAALRRLFVGRES